MLSPKLLQTFITLVETGNFTRTAESLFMTQPGVSQHIKKLESVCDCELLTRRAKGVQLTEQGRRLYQYALESNNKQARFIEALKFDAPFEGKCSIGCSGAIAQRVYPALTHLQRDHLKLNVQVEVSPQRRILTAVENGEIDIGIVTHQPVDALYESHYLGEEPLSLFLPSQTDLSEPIHETLNTLGIINHPDANYYVQLYFNHCGEPALADLPVTQLNQAGYINQLSQILLPVSEGVGFTVLPTSVKEFVSFADSLTVYSPKNYVSEPLYLIQSHYRELPKRYEFVIDTIQHVIQTSVS